MKRIAPYCIIFFFAFAACSCDDDDTGGIPPITTPTNNMPIPDMDEEDDSVPEMDMDGPDFTVDTPGFLHGEWEVRTLEGDNHLATLRFRHEDGATSAIGTYRLIQPESHFGLLNATSWSNDVLTTSWDARVNNRNENFQITDAQVFDSRNRLRADYNSTLIGAAIRVNLVRLVEE